MMPMVNGSLRINLLVPCLLLCTFLATSMPFFLGTLLVDIAASFKVSIGTASQLSIISNLMGIVMGLALSIISIKIKHRSLLLMGNALFAFGTLLYFMAQNFFSVILVSFLLGASASTIIIMVYTLIGEQLPLEGLGAGFNCLKHNGIRPCRIILIRTYRKYRRMENGASLVFASVICFLLRFERVSCSLKTASNPARC